MLGVALPGIAPVAQPAPLADPNLLARKPASGTILGVAVPGIAPTHAAPAQGRAPASRTMLGVAAPGIAPTYASPGAPRAPLEPAPEVLPAPAPLAFEPLPDAPVVPQKKGFPIALAAGIAAGVLVLGAVAIALAVRGSAPLVASPRLGESGKEQIHLVCESCADGTTVSLEGAKATFANHQADLDLSKPLVVGDNPFTLTLDRPSMGRDEQVKVVMPVAYRIRADLGAIGASPPAIQILVEALPGDTVTLDGKPVALDAGGRATVVIDVSSEVTGEGDAKTIERKLPYVIVEANGKKSEGEVSAKVGVLPLYIDAPGPRATVESDKMNVAGRTSKGAQVTINGALASVGDDGAFGVRAPVPEGESATLVVRAQAKGAGGDLAPRIVTIPVRRVPSLAAEASSLEKNPSLGYAALVADFSAATGKAVVVEGNVLDARTQNHGTVMVVDDRVGCAKSPCLVRVLYGGDTPIASGDAVRAFGSVRGAFANKDGTRVPEVNADFLLKGKSK